MSKQCPFYHEFPRDVKSKRIMNTMFAAICTKGDFNVTEEQAREFCTGDYMKCMYCNSIPGRERYLETHPQKKSSGLVNVLIIVIAGVLIYMLMKWANIL